MIPFSQIAIIEKNKLESDSPFILLVEIILSETETVYLCRNTENVEFEGETWFAYDLQIGEIEEDKNNCVSLVNLKIANVSGMLDSLIDKYLGLTNAVIKLHTILVRGSEVTKEITLSFNVAGSGIDGDYLSLNLTGFNPFEIKCPRATLRKLVCRYKNFKGERCGYTGDENYCDHSLRRCQELGNVKNFGGVPNMGWGGIFV